MDLELMRWILNLLHINIMYVMLVLCPLCVTFIAGFFSKDSCMSRISLFDSYIINN